MALKSFCTSKDVCLRSSMILSLGGSTQQNSVCCMVCHPSAISDGGRLSILQEGKAPPRKKRRAAVRKLDKPAMDHLKSHLKAERAQYIKEHTTFAMLGDQMVCPDSVIESICSSAKFISQVADMNVFSLRQDLKLRFFDVIMSPQ